MPNEIRSPDDLRFAFRMRCQWIPDADVVLANILAGPLVQLAPRLTALVRQEGKLVLSGLLANQADEVEAAYAADFILERRVQDGWAMLTGRKTT